MRVFGIKWLALLAAAMAVYITGFIIYGALVPTETWLAWSDISQEDMDRVGTSRMIYSALMPVMIAIGVGLVIKWRGVSSVSEGISTGFILALLFLVGGRLYGFIYGVEGFEILLLDTLHLLLNGVVAGAVLGGWSNRSYDHD